MMPEQSDNTSYFENPNPMTHNQNSSSNFFGQIGSMMA
jgi:hypothetical protein